MSIYEFTKRKLISHGVQNTDDGKLTLSDKALFLLFVKLERARQTSDFEAIRLAVSRIENHVKEIGKHHLVLFGYMYIRFSTFTPKQLKYDYPSDKPGVTYSKYYERDLSGEEIAIGEWALAMCHRYERSMFRAIYGSKRDHIEVTVSNFIDAGTTMH